MDDMLDIMETLQKYCARFPKATSDQVPDTDLVDGQAPKQNISVCVDLYSIIHTKILYHTLSDYVDTT